MLTTKAVYRLIIVLVVFLLVLLFVSKILTQRNHVTETLVIRRVASTTTASAKCDCNEISEEHSKVKKKPPFAVNLMKVRRPILKVDPERISEFNKFTVIIPTYRRVLLLKRLLFNFCNLTSLVDTVIVVWNNVEEPIPKNLLDITCHVRLFFKKEEVNSLNNRFKHFPEIRTEGN